MTKRVCNFGAGPAMLPESVLLEAQAELLDWRNLGMSVLEVGHRTHDVMELLAQAESSLRELLAIPQNYHILFLGGAARTQFAMIPMNVLGPKEQAGYLVSGVWSKMAFDEAQRLKAAYCVATGEPSAFTSIPDRRHWVFQKNTAYLYYTPNETVNGLRVPFVPETEGVPLVADMTSCLLSEPLDVSQYALIFAGAQKNIANSGLTLVIIRDDWIEKVSQSPIPSMLSYKVHAQHHSLYATPPVFNCYLAAKMLDWVKNQGGVSALYRANCLKAEKLYHYIDSSDFYVAPVNKRDRSIMNVCFSLRRPDLENRWIELAYQQGLAALQGHRLVGGLRASLYNSMPISGVDALIQFMIQFAKDNSH